MNILSDAYSDPAKAEFYSFVRALDAARRAFRAAATPCCSPRIPPWPSSSIRRSDKAAYCGRIAAADRERIKKERKDAGQFSLAGALPFLFLRCFVLRAVSKSPSLGHCAPSSRASLPMKSCTLVTMVRTDRLPRSCNLPTANSEMSME